MRLFLSVLLCSISLFTTAQKKEKIQILNAEEFRYSEKSKKDAQRLIGNVQLKHQDVLMFCDSAYMYKSSSYVEAFGNVKIKQGDSLTLYGDYLQYVSDEKKADIQRNVRLVRPDLVLSTDRMIMDRNTNMAYYENGGTIKSTTDNNTLVSKKGYFHMKSNVMYFKEEVILTSPEYTISSDTMRYNTNNSEVSFFGPTEIVSKENYIYCENGYYNTITERSIFYKNAYLLSDNKELRGDTIAYDRERAYGEARSNVSIIDTVENIIVKGNLVEGINNNFLDTGFSSVLNTRAILLFILLISLNITAYFNSGFKYVCLIMLVYMLNSAIDNAVLFSGFMHLTDRPYFSAFSVTRPLFIIALFWVFIIHKDKKKSIKKV